MLVDTIDDAVGARYSGMPSRLYLIDHRGKVAYKSGRGPFGFKPAELEQSLVLLLQDEFPELKAEGFRLGGRGSEKPGAVTEPPDNGAPRPRASTPTGSGSADRDRTRTSRGLTAWMTRVNRRHRSDKGLARRLGLATATAMVVGEVIGVGIFLTPAGMAQVAGLAGLADRRLADHGRQRGRRAPLTSAAWRRGIRRPAGSTSTSARPTARGSASSTAGCRCW